MGSTFLKGTFVLTIGGLVVKVIGSLNWIILSRVLGGEGIGLYQMAFPIYLLALSLSSAGIPVAISIMTAEKVAFKDYRGAKHVFKLSLVLLAVSGIALSLLVYFGADWLVQSRIIRDARAYYAILALAPAVFLVTILASFRGYLQGWQMMTPTAVSQIVEQLFRVAAMLGFAVWLLPRGLQYAAGGASMGAAIGAAGGLTVLVYYYRKLQRKFPTPIQSERVQRENSFRLFSRMLKLALPVSLAGIMLPLVSNLDLLIVPVRLEAAGFSIEKSTELFGYLTGMAVPLMNLATIATAAMATSLVPAMSEAKAMGNERQISQRTSSALRMANLVTLPAAVVLWILAIPVSSVIYHAPEAGGVVRVVAVGVYLLGFHQVTTGILQGMGHTFLPVINMGIAAVVKVALNWQLTAIPSLGILGSGWATNADIGVAVLLNLLYIRSYIKISMGERYVFWKTALSALLMGISVQGLYVLCTASGIGDALAIFLVSLSSVVIFTVILLPMGGITRQDIHKIPLLGARLAAILTQFHLLKP